MISVVGSQGQFSRGDLVHGTQAREYARERYIVAAIERERSVVEHISNNAAARSPIANQERPTTNRGAAGISISCGQEQPPNAALSKRSDPSGPSAKGREGGCIR